MNTRVFASSCLWWGAAKLRVQDRNVFVPLSEVEVPGLKLQVVASDEVSGVGRESAFTGTIRRSRQIERRFSVLLLEEKECVAMKAGSLGRT